MKMIVGCLLALAGTAFAQPQAPAFDVVSVRPVQEPRGQLFSFSSSGPRVRYVAYAVAQLVMEAYDLKKYQVTFAPTVMPPAAGYYNPALYDIEARAEGEGVRTRDAFRPMLQALLADRFKLKVHREMRELPVYALVAGKDRPKLKESAPDAVESASIGVNGRNQNITASKNTMAELAQMIPNIFFLERPVVDRTGLAGTYDFRIEATPEFRMAGDAPDPNNISIFIAVQQQLGLKLEPQKAMIEVLVIDHVERPSEN